VATGAGAPAGWTQEHINSAFQTLAATKGAPAVAALLAKYGVRSVTAIPGHLWPQVYAEATGQPAG